jgi:long-chain fatty acid transport protein
LNFLLVFMLVSSQMLMAGGLKTNVNQSAAWARTLARDATLDIDGVYFNPAGLAHLGNGLHLSLSNQSIWQTRTITSDYTYLTGTPVDYNAELSAPIYPSIYVAYQMDKWTFSPIASLVPQLSAALAPVDLAIVGADLPDPGFRNISGYNMNVSFRGQSAYYGYQAGATYAISDMISVYLGGRLVTAKNEYEGSISGITIDAPVAYGGTMPAGDYFRIVAMTPGLPPAVVAQLNGTASALDIATADAELVAKQTGTGFTPIIGVNIRVSDMLNIGARYEHHTKIELTNDTEVNYRDMYPDDSTSRGDLPGMFSMGAQVKPLKNLTASLGFTYYWDKAAYYGKTDGSGEQINNESIIDENHYTYQFALEYKILPMLGVSAGYTSGNLGVNEDYQNSMTYALKSQTFGGGIFVDISEMIRINAAYNLTTYQGQDQAFTYDLAPGITVPYTDSYAKQTSIFAIGVDFRF